jgi:hypothetical protein
MVRLNTNLGSICHRALVNQQIYWRVERDFRDVMAKHRRCCRNCHYFDDNPYLPCAVDPIQAEMPDKDNACKFFERNVE